MSLETPIQVNTSFLKRNGIGYLRDEPFDLVAVDLRIALDDTVRDGLGPRVPVLHLMSEHFLHWRPNAESTARHARGCTHTLSRLTWLRDSRHNNFSDISIFSPILNRLMKSTGKIDHFRALQAIGQLSAAFLAGDFDARALQFPELAAVTDLK